MLVVDIITHFHVLHVHALGDLVHFAGNGAHQFIDYLRVLIQQA